MEDHSCGVKSVYSYLPRCENGHPVSVLNYESEAKQTGNGILPAHGYKENNTYMTQYITQFPILKTGYWSGTHAVVSDTEVGNVWARTLISNSLN